MSKRHAKKNGRALCRTTGNKSGFHVVAVSAAEWNALGPAQRCVKCSAILSAAKAQS